MDRDFLDFIKESNEIEGITSYDEAAQYDAYQRFMHLDSISIGDIETLAFRLYQTSMDTNGNKPVIRRKKGQNVRVGNHRPQDGGYEIQHKLQILLMSINDEKNSTHAFNLHCEYEKLHPLTDCNGRTGRALWGWLMLKDDYSFRLGFLHKWYYQSLDNLRS